MTNAISLMTANYVARETGYDMQGGGHGDRATNERFRPLEPFPQLFDELPATICGLGLENHQERSPGELVKKIGDDADVLGATVDTGWFGTQGYDPARATEELAPHAFGVQLKDVRRAGEHHTCRWGEGVVPIEGCVRALRRVGYLGAVTLEHEPDAFDPADDIRAMRALLEERLA